MSNHERHQTAGEQLIADVFGRLESSADPQIARLRLERKLRSGETERPATLGVSSAPRQSLRPGFRLLALLAGILALSSWASGLNLPGWDDGQQITIRLHDSFTPAEYPHWVGLMAKHSLSLEQHGGHSLVVDYKEATEHDGYYLQLSILGVDASTANSWIREVMAQVPELSGQRYGITQPLLSYNLTVADMLAHKLGGSTDAVERCVARAWETSNVDTPSSNGRLYLIAQPVEYSKRVSMLTE